MFQLPFRCKPAHASVFASTPLKSLLTATSSLVFLSATSAAFSADIAVEWDPVDDSRVAYYEVQWGTESGVYRHKVTSTSTSAMLTGLQDAATYYVAAKACAEGGSECSDYSNELIVTNASTQPKAPVASFEESATSGFVPLTVTFRSTSEGPVDSCTWNFGNGKTATGCQAVETFTDVGAFSVTLTVQGIGGVAETSKASLIKTSPLPLAVLSPVAQFTSGATSGRAPLSVSFISQAVGDVSGYLWDFGDGTTSAEVNPTHTYTETGSYDVRLTVSGPGGSDTDTQIGYVEVGDDELPIEVGEVSVNHEWKRVDFATAFTDPVVVAKSFSRKGGQSATVRIDGVDATGFSIRIQEWEYLDGRHVNEDVTYVAIERGQHELSDGTWIEADELNLSGADRPRQQLLAAPFSSIPVVIAGVVSDNDDTAVTTRLHNIRQSSFDLRLQEQEANKQGQHGSESVAYIAWEPSKGDVSGLQFEVAQGAKAVTSTDARILFGGKYATPLWVLADMQTTNGGDTAVLRWSHKDAASIDLGIQEEQSRDGEMNHIKENIGYILLSKTDSSQP